MTRGDGDEGRGYMHYLLLLLNALQGGPVGDGIGQGGALALRGRFLLGGGGLML